MKHGGWDARIRRANELASVYPFAAEGLRFYARVGRLQSALYAEGGTVFANASTSSQHSLHEELANPALLPKFKRFAESVRQFAPELLAKAAAELADRGPAEHPVDDFLAGEFNFPIAANETNEADAPDANPRHRLLAWLFLQPFAEFLAERREPANTAVAPSTCPICGSNPIVGVLRPEGEGGRKSLICMLCAHEWAFRRIYCPACGEEREPQMAFYSAPEIAHVRVDVCDTCRTYLKTVDMTRTGLAVPVVDELAAIPLDLWAREHRYAKLQNNVLGI